tara:strand:- start:1548 stop:1943 length:396 start_codon:yes stop_codon:yes gene_type:complete
VIGTTSRVLIFLSVILNGVLLSFLFGLVPFLLYVSAVINLILLWYVKNVLSQTEVVQDNVLEIFEKLDVFSDHLEQVHAMEMFYGEPILQDLINHSKQLINDIVDIQQQYYDIDQGLEEEYDTEEDSQEKE